MSDWAEQALPKNHPLRHKRGIARKSEDSAALPSPQEGPNCSELLKLLEGILLFEPFVRGSRTHQGNFQNWLAAANAEIAKAKGETL